MSIYFISSEKAYFWHIVSLSIGPIVLIPTAFLSSSPFDMIGVWCAYPTSESIVFLIGVALYFVSIKKSKTLEPENDIKVNDENGIDKGA